MTIEDKGEIRVAIVGVGNCANSLVQGITYYKDATNDSEIPGLMHPVLGGYHIKNINFVLAFDVEFNFADADAHLLELLLISIAKPESST